MKDQTTQSPARPGQVQEQVASLNNQRSRLSGAIDNLATRIVIVLVGPEGDSKVRIIKRRTGSAMSRRCGWG